MMETNPIDCSLVSPSAATAAVAGVLAGVVVNEATEEGGVVVVVVILVVLGLVALIFNASEVDNS